MHNIIHPSNWAPTKGYSAGVLASGHQLFIAGQIGWDVNQQFTTDDMVEQFGYAFDHVLAVLKEAGGSPEHLTEMTIYVTDLDEYRGRLRELGAVWRPRFGRHYPAMALVGVSGLVERRAKVEVQARAVLPITKD